MTKKSTAKKKKKRDLSGLKAQAEASGDLAVVGGSVTGLNLNQLPVDFIRTLFEDINKQAPGTFDCTEIIEGKDKPQPVSKATAKARLEAHLRALFKNDESAYSTLKDKLTQRWMEANLAKQARKDKAGK